MVSKLLICLKLVMEWGLNWEKKMYKLHGLRTVLHKTLLIRGRNWKNKYKFGDEGDDASKMENKYLLFVSQQAVRCTHPPNNRGGTLDGQCIGQRRSRD